MRTAIGSVPISINIDTRRAHADGGSTSSLPPSLPQIYASCASRRPRCSWAVHVASCASPAILTTKGPVRVTDQGGGSGAVRVVGRPFRWEDRKPCRVFNDAVFLVDLCKSHKLPLPLHRRRAAQTQHPSIAAYHSGRSISLLDKLVMSRCASRTWRAFAHRLPGRRLGVC